MALTTEAHAALLKELRALPRYYVVPRYAAHGGALIATDPENPERGQFVKLADVEAVLAAETVPLHESRRRIV